MFLESCKEQKDVQLLEEFAQMRKDGLDEKIKKMQIQNPVLGFAVSHNSCTKTSWLVPVATPNRPLLIDYEFARLDSPAIDIGLLWALDWNMDKFPD